MAAWLDSTVTGTREAVARLEPELPEGQAQGKRDLLALEA